jgi:hypothetical protein
VIRRVPRAVALASAAALALATCGRESLPPLQAPSDPAGGEFPLWAAVGDASSFAVSIHAAAALETPLVGMCAQLARIAAARRGVDTASLADALGFDPVMDVEEAFVTDAGPADPDTGTRRLVVLLRYAVSVANLEVVLKLLGSASLEGDGPAVDEPQVAIVALDDRTVALLGGVGDEEVGAWMDGTSHPSKTRLRAARAVFAGFEDPYLGSQADRVLDAWIDAEAVARSGSRVGPPGPGGLAGIVPPWDGMVTSVLHASLAGRLRVIARTEFADGAAARDAADAIALMFDKIGGGPAALFLGPVLGRIAETLEVDVEGEFVEARLEVPEDVIDALSAVLSLVVAAAIAAGDEGAGSAPGLPLLPPGRVPGGDAPSVPGI